jgi:very-short-patch-repair endonuclease
MRQRVSNRSRGFARNMRKEPTDAEARLWYHLRGGRLEGMRFRRQVPIGGFIVDFVCFDRRRIVELDGSQHAESAKDKIRDADLTARGFRVFRFWNDVVLAETDAGTHRDPRRLGLTFPLTNSIRVAISPRAATSPIRARRRFRLGKQVDGGVRGC